MTPLPIGRDLRKPIPESEKKMKISTFKSQNPSVKSAELVEGLERNWPFRMYKIHYIHMDDSSSCHHYEYEKIPDTNPANFIKNGFQKIKRSLKRGMGPDCRIQGQAVYKQSEEYTIRWR